MVAAHAYTGCQGNDVVSAHIRMRRVPGDYVINYAGQTVLPYYGTPVILETLFAIRDVNGEPTALLFTKNGRRILIEHGNLHLDYDSLKEGPHKIDQDATFELTHKFREFIGRSIRQ